MSEIRYKIVLDDADARKQIRELLKGMDERATNSIGNDAKKTEQAVNAITEAQKKLKDAQLENIESIRRLREERSKEISDLNALQQVESKAKALLAEKQNQTESLIQKEKELSAKYKQGQIDLQEYNKSLRDQAEERRKLREEQKKEEKTLRDVEKAKREADKAEQLRQKNLEKNRAQLEKESSAYYQLNAALGKVRKESKDVLAEMFKLEKQGGKNSAAYQLLSEKSSNLVKQTNILDQGVKKIDATVGQHQRNVGNYASALDNMIPIIGRVNAQLAGFGVSLDDLAGKPGAIKELGAAFANVGRSLLTFLISPIGLAITALASLFALFKANKQTVIDFNNGLLNVSKTTGLAGLELQAMADAIVKLSRSLQTVSTAKLLEYATIAGQLGVKGTENIMNFTEALAKLETASDISGEKGGAEIARMLTLVDGGVQNVKSFGDEIVNLGNNFAATESEILANAEAIAQNTGLYKVGRQDVLAYATATKSLGIEAEVVGSSFQKTLSTFEKSIRSGKGIADILKVVGGSSAELQRRFREDASGVFQDYIKGLNGIFKAGGSVQAQLEKNGITDIRQTRVIGTLATGYDTLARAMETVKNASGALQEEFETASGKLVNQTQRIGIAWDNLVLSVENGQGTIGVASVAVVGFFADILEAITPNISASDALTSAYESQRSEIESLDKKLSPLISQYNDLKEKGSLNVKEQNLLKDVINEIATLIPGVVTEWDRYGNALELNSEKVLGLSSSYRQLLKDMNISVIDDLNKQFEESEKWVSFYEKNLNDVASNDNITFLFTNREKSVKQWTESLANANNESLQIIKNLQKVGSVLTTEQTKILEGYGLIGKASVPLDVKLPERFRRNQSPTKELSFSESLRLINNKSELDAIKKSTQKKMEALTPSDPQISEYKKQLDEIAKLELAYSSGAKSKQADRAVERSAEQRRQAVERQRALQLSIDQNHAQVSRNMLSLDQQEFESIKDKYAKMREEARKFYADPKNKVDGKQLNVDLGTLQGDENFEISEAKTRQKTVELMKELDVQKSIYDEYNAYVEQNGVEAADKIFGKQSEIAKNYIENLAAEYRELLGKEKIAFTGGSGVAQFTQAEEERLKALKVLLDANAKQEEIKKRKNLAEALTFAKSYNDQLLEIDKKYQDAYAVLGKNITEDQKEILKNRRESEINSLNENEAAKNKILVKGAKQYLLFTTANIVAQIKTVKSLLAQTDLSDEFRKELEGNLSGLQNALKLGATATNLATLKDKASELRAELVKLTKTKGANPEEIRKVNSELIHTQEEIDGLTNDSLAALFDFLQKVFQSVNQLGESFSNLGEAFGNSTISSIGSLLSGLASNLDGLSVAFDKNASKSDRYASAVSSLVSIVSMITNATVERKRSEEEYYRSVIQLQQDYNLSLNERLRLESQLGESIYVKDYIGRVKDGIEAANDAMTKCQKALSELSSKGQAKTGQRNAVDWGSVGKGATSGAAIGATIGTVIPVIGNIIGGVVGGIIGGIVGLFSKKKKDTFTSILKEYPELIKRTADGLLDIDKSLAEQLIKNNAVNDETKQILQNVLEWADALEQARAQIREVVTELSGALGNDLRNGLVEAFKAGENAAVAMGKSVSKILEDMLSQLLFAKAFDALFKTLENQLTDALAFGNENDVINSFSKFLDGAGVASGQYFEWLEMFKKEAQKKGIDVFGSTASNSQLSSSGIERITEQTGTELLGLFRSTYDINKRQENSLSTLVQNANARLASLNAIQQNTYNTAQEANKIALNTYDIAVHSLKISENTAQSVTELKGINKAVNKKYGN